MNAKEQAGPANAGETVLSAEQVEEFALQSDQTITREDDIALIHRIAEAASRGERERCAKIAQGCVPDPNELNPYSWGHGFASGRTEAAAAIRSGVRDGEGGA